MLKLLIVICLSNLARHSSLGEQTIDRDAWTKADSKHFQSIKTIRKIFSIFGGTHTYVHNFYVKYRRLN